MPAFINKINRLFLRFLTFISAWLTYYLGLSLSYLSIKIFRLFKPLPQKPQSNWHPINLNSDLTRMY